MKKSVKIILTIVTAILFFLVGGAVGNMPPSDAKGPICLIVFAVSLKFYREFKSRKCAFKFWC